jgi:hypothetical protein
VFSYRTGATFAAVALSMLAACSDSTAPKKAAAADCSAEMTIERKGYGNPVSVNDGTNADGSTWETWFYGSGVNADPFHSTRFTWGGTLTACKVERFAQ